ncbi:hypothetical protein HRED_07976 [Candidatus Haloredivivus sp. G17]|nr:hypothetical protein HRED_07976 [Candidatus Haloredivivus sp. G17]
MPKADVNLPTPLLTEFLILSSWLAVGGSFTGLTPSLISPSVSESNSSSESPSDRISFPVSGFLPVLAVLLEIDSCASSEEAEEYEFH